MGWLLVILWRLGPLKQIKTNKAALSVLAAISFIWLPIKGPPVSSERGLRSFTDRYVMTQSNWNTHNANSSYADIVQSAFGGARSLREALFMNPGEFARHVMYNIGKTPGALVQNILPEWERFRWPGMLALIALCIHFAAGFRKRKGDPGAPGRQYGFVLPVSLVFCLLGLGTAALMYAHERYLLQASVLSLVMILMYVGRIPKRFGPAVVLPVCLALYLITPTYTNRDAWFQVLPSPCSQRQVLPNRATIEFLSGIHMKEPPVIFSPEGFFYDIYLPGSRLVQIRDMYQQAYFSPTIKSEAGDFATFIENNGINLIIAGEVRHPRFDWNEPTFQDFLQNHEKYGFHRFPIPQVPSKIILVKW
ncbi:MAG: hypothetical protein GY849_12975 [Deltaproteobacteria bacterium]|nr:hypothetical protein [Deltaproteobacteria bacterium]